MPRGPRVDAPGAVHHVMVRGIERRAIFLDTEDYEVFLALLDRLVPELSFRCFGWVLMPNHVHLALETGPVPLPRLMARVGTAYAVYFNRRHNRVGHLLQNRYRSRLVHGECDLVGLVLYIHRNPLRAGLVSGPNDLGRFVWCGQGALTGERQARPFESPQATLRLLDQNLAQARQKLFSLVQASPELHETLEGADRTETAVQRTAQSRGCEESHSVERLIDSICETHALSRDALAPGRKGRRVTAARTDFVRRATAELGLSGRAIARALGISDASVSRALARAREAGIAAWR